MQYIILVLAMIISFPQCGITEDSKPSSTTSAEQELIQKFESAALKAKNPVIKEENIKPEVASSTSSTPKKQNTDVMLADLTREIEDLRSKNIMSKIESISTQKIKDSKHIGNKVFYSYREGEIYELRAGIDRITDVELQPGEYLTNPPVSGDTVRWKIAIIKSGAGLNEVVHVIVKPIDTEIETNLVLTTNKHVYHLRAIASDWYMPAIAWEYPDEEYATLQEQLKRQEETITFAVSPESLYFGYNIDGDRVDWRPVRVFDDGVKTYLQMPKALKSSEAPALFVKEENKAMLVNYRIKGDYYIVDRLFEEAELRVGTKRKIEIVNERYHRSFFERIFE